MTATSVRAIDPSMDTAVVSDIDAMLARVESEHGVRILWAAESGSRAWGFPSPDSDYDCRFIYTRPNTDYLSLRPVRDVIEHPVDEVFDVSGWDVRKALSLMVKGNAAPGEWLRSPITYRGDAAVRNLLLATAAQVVPFDALLGHHLHVARNNLDLLRRTGRAKKFLYALREAATCRWLLEHGPGLVPPMTLTDLVAESGVPDGVHSEVAGLIEAKRTLSEGGTLPVPALLAQFVDRELERTEQRRAEHSGRSGKDEAWRIADEAFHVIQADDEALRVLDRKRWLNLARADAVRLRGENLNDTPPEGWTGTHDAHLG